MRTKLFALVAVVGVLWMAIGPGVAAAAESSSGNATDGGEVVDDEPPAENGTFGLEVGAYVQSLIVRNDTDGIGQKVAAFATANNPGNAPDHAGPLEHAGPDDENESVNATDGGQGSPEHAGPGHADESANETHSGNGPPAHAGGPDEGDDGDDESDVESDGDRGNGNGGGPPEHAGNGKR